MEFKNDITNLRKLYFDIVKTCHKDKGIIFKMIFEKMFYNNVSEVDLAFRTCMLNRFSDKAIAKMYNKDVEKAILLLRARARGCMYIILAINELMDEGIMLAPNCIEKIMELKQINQNIYSIARESVRQSNDWAIKYNIPLFDDKEFDYVDEYNTNKPETSIPQPSKNNA